MLIKEINKNFLLPIEFDSHKKEIFENLYEDLELLKQTNSKESAYQKVFQAKSPAGKELMEKWCKYYTTNKQFLKDSQKLYKNFHTKKLNYQPSIIQDCWDKWHSIKTMENFIEKFQYLEWEKLEFLNKSEMFLAVLTFYQSVSPILSLLAPVILLLIPFLILKVLKRPITLSEYIRVLMEQLDKHSMGQLFTRFDSLSWGQRVYLMMCCGMYVYQIYQNAMSCYHFYMNTKQINQTFQSFKNYLEYTKKQMNMYLNSIKAYPSHAAYSNYIKVHLEKIEKLYEIINNIPLSSLNPQKFASMGKIMKEFYVLQTSPEIEKLLLFTFGFHGYIESIQGVNKNIRTKKINKIKFKTSKTIKLELKDAYHPCIENEIVTNTVDMSNNKIITGPNAAGKTTLLKTTVINVLLAQQIGYSFCKSGSLSPFDYIHCYLNIPDTNARDSLFQAEARRCSNILNFIENHKTAKHFCIFDELFSGTNPYEAVATAYGYLSYISKNPNIRFMLTTHYIRLCKLFKKTKNIENANMETKLINDTPRYSYKIVKGISKIKGGIMVLRQLDYPEKIIEEANNIIQNL